MNFRVPTQQDLPELSALCLRSKAYWGYDAAFIEACREELTLTPDDLAAFHFRMAERDGTALGVAAVSKAPVDQSIELELLFIDAPAIGTGVGGALFDWAVTKARKTNAKTMKIVADPDAVPFYMHKGAVLTGNAPSGSIPGRVLPVLHLTL